jgi:hypothetical protein
MSLQGIHSRNRETGRVLILFAVSCLVMSVGFTGAVAAGNDPPRADFTADVRSGTAPLAVTFTDASSNNPTGWAWFFGDEAYAGPWTRQTPNAKWSERGGARSVVMPDGSIVLMGGGDSITGFITDVWRSADSGKTWTLVAAGLEWMGAGQTGVVTPEGSIVLMGGVN